MSDVVLYEIRDGIATITLNQPERRNPLNNACSEALVRCLRQAADDPAVRCVLLTGAGKAFCAGGDIGEFRAAMDQSVVDLWADSHRASQVFALAHRYAKPIVSAVNGSAFGGGLGLVALSHIAIAADTARLGLTEVTLGMFPYAIFPLVRRAVGDRRALELTLTGRVFTSQEAREYGLVTEVVPAESLMSRAMEVAASIAGRSPVAVQTGLSGYYDTMNMDVDDAVAYMTNLRLVSFKSEDLREGAAAFLEKRTPVWKGR